jgi:hypothetical protein
MGPGRFQMRKPFDKVCMRLTLKRPLFARSKKIPERVDSITNKITDTYHFLQITKSYKGHLQKWILMMDSYSRAF